MADTCIYLILWLMVLLLVPEDGVDKALETCPLEGLHIVAFGTSSHLQGRYLTGDKQTIRVDPKGGLLSAVLKLLAAYYTFDIQCP